MNTLATTESIETTVSALKENGFEPVVVASKEEALAKVKELIPEGASLMTGASETLRGIGFTDYLKEGSHPWNNLHEAVLAEKDPAKQAQLRRESVLSDFYAGSVHALTETGELVIASNSGSQLPHIVFTSPNLVLVVGANKIVPSAPEALERIEKHIIPLEDERMKGVYGFGTSWTKTVVLHKENPALGRKVYVVIVKESLGF
jgi:L-lactate utilization protein LutB